MTFLVITGLVPVIPIRRAQPCPTKRDRRDKPGDDNNLPVREVPIELARFLVERAGGEPAVVDAGDRRELREIA
jgi:hypothetical protein